MRPCVATVWPWRPVIYTRSCTSGRPCPHQWFDDAVQVGGQLHGSRPVEHHDSQLRVLAVCDQPGYRLHRRPGPQRRGIVEPSGARAVAVRPTGTGVVLPS